MRERTGVSIAVVGELAARVRRGVAWWWRMLWAGHPDAWMWSRDDDVARDVRGGGRA